MKVKLFTVGTKRALLTLLAPLSWGTTYVTVTELLPPDRPLFVTSMRVLPAGLILASTGFVLTGWRPRGKQWRPTAILALFNFGIFFPLLVVAIYRLPGGVAASLGGIQPLLVALTSWVIRSNRPRRLDLAIGLVAMAGVALVVIRPDANIDPVGVFAAVGANVSFSIGVVLTKFFPPPENRLAATGWQLTISALIIIPLATAFEGTPPDLELMNLVGFAYLSLIATGAAFALWFTGVQKLPTQAPPLLGLAAPITGATLGWLLLNESLTKLQVSGFIITITAIIYGATLGSRPQPTSIGGFQPLNQ